MSAFKKDLNATQSMLAGGLAGFTNALCVAPLDVVKARQQVQHMQMKDKKSSFLRYRGTWHTMRTIFKEEHIPGLYRGLRPTIIG